MLRRCHIVGHLGKHLALGWIAGLRHFSDGNDDFTPVFGWKRGDGEMWNTWDRCQQGFNFIGINPIATGLNDIGHATRQEQSAEVVNETKVPRGMPTIRLVGFIALCGDHAY